MLLKRYYFCSFIAAIAVLSDLLIIFLGVVPFYPGQVFLELLVACYVSIALLSLMVIGVVALIVWKRHTPDMPRPPDTVAGVMSYVADSRMLEDFEGAEFLDDRDLTTRISNLGKKYKYGRQPGSDGQMRYMVDEQTSLNYS